MTSSACPHCGASDNYASALFCHHCHKALPVPGAEPRLVDGIGRPMTMSGHAVALTDENTAHPVGGCGALLAVAILQTVVGGILFLFGAQMPGVNPATVTVAGAFVAGIGIAFFLLYVWSHRMPLAASITGLALYLLITLGDAALDPASLRRGMIFKIIIVVLLCRSIAAAAKARDPRAAEAMM